MRYLINRNICTSAGLQPIETTLQFTICFSIQQNNFENLVFLFCGIYCKAFLFLLFK